MVLARALLLSALIASPATAADRDLVDWFKVLCVATAPTFGDLDTRVTALGGKQIEWDRPSLLAMIDVTQYRVWTMDAPMIRNTGFRIIRSVGTVGQHPARSCWMSPKFVVGAPRDELLPLSSAAVVEARLKAELSLEEPLSEGPLIFYGWHKRWNLPMGEGTVAFVDIQQPTQMPPETQFASLVIIIIIDTATRRGGL